MLKFIIGKPASGKTFQAVNIIKELCENNKKSILLVPEQFTFENERLLLKTLGDSAVLNTSVLSFSRLCDEVGRIYGCVSGILLSDSDKIIFMSRTLKACANSLKLWGKYTSSLSFAKTMLDAVGEFRINAVTPDDLRKAAQNVKSSLALKINDIATIYDEYNMLLGEKFIDSIDAGFIVFDDIADKYLVLTQRLMEERDSRAARIPFDNPFRQMFISSWDRTIEEHTPLFTERFNKIMAEERERLGIQ